MLRKRRPETSLNGIANHTDGENVKPRIYIAVFQNLYSSIFCEEKQVNHLAWNFHGMIRTVNKKHHGCFQEIELISFPKKKWSKAGSLRDGDTWFRPIAVDIGPSEENSYFVAPLT